MELIVVVGVISLLMSMVLGIQRYAQAKSSRSRAEGEVAALGAAAEAYKVDMASYPRSAETDAMPSLGSIPENSYYEASRALYAMLSGDADLNGRPDVSEGKANSSQVYFAFKGAMLRMTGTQVSYIRDPWDSGAIPRAYGYSTKRAALLSSGKDDPSAGHNITFDLWSTANAPENPAAWITNW